jgi:peptidylprolyl isomerase
MTEKIKLFAVTFVVASTLCACAQESTTKSGDVVVESSSGQQAAAPESTMPKGQPGAMSTTPSGLQYQDTVVGNGASPQPGQRVTVNYTGWLTNGKQFDSSVGREPFTFTIGQGEVIKGWDEGVASMKIGGKRRLTVPPHLGYGERGAGADIPPNSTLIFDVDLLGVQ